MVNVLCRAMTNPSIKHIEAAKHGLRYLAWTADADITYRHDSNRKPDMQGDADNMYLQYAATNWRTYIIDGETTKRVRTIDL
jgi:hypothetical protein